MAVTKVASTPQEIIRKGLSSLDSCSSNTASLLHDVLFSGPSRSDKNGPAASKHARTKSTAAKLQPSTSSASITDEQRSRIAVEALNNVLQLLKDAAAPKPGSTKPGKLGGKALLDSVIDCGRHSISYLNSKADCGLRPGTRESAHLNFVNRLLQAGKLDICGEELMSLKARISSVKVDEKKRTLVSIFSWNLVPEEQEVLGLAINVQTAGLRLLAAKSDIQILQKIPRLLEQPRSIYEMISRLQKLSPVKAAKHFDTLATALYACASALANTKDNDPSRRASSRVVIELKFSSITCRLQSIEAQGSTPSTSQLGELWALVSHSITGLRSYFSSESAKQDFQTMIANLRSIFSKLLCREFPLDGFEPKLLASSVAIATVSEEAQAWDEAIGFLKNVEERLNPKQHQGIVSSCRVRTATSVLKASAAAYTMDNSTELLQRGLEVIKQPLSGSREKLQGLFNDIMQLRRASSSCLNSKHASDSIAWLCVEICFAVIGFSRRCALAGILDLQASSKERAMIVSSVDHFLVSSRKIPRGDSITAWWELEDQRLQEILALAQILEDNNEATEVEGQPASQKQSLFEKVSVFYQQHSITLRKENQTDKSIHAFKRSISCLESRSVEDASSGNLAVKQEKLGTLYLESGDVTKAIESFEAALRAHASTGDFGRLTSRFGETQLETFLNNEEKAIGRCLNQYIKCCIDSRSQFEFWSSKDLSEDENCTTLLFQIQSALNCGSSKGSQVALPHLYQLLSTSISIPIENQARVAMLLVSMISDIREKELPKALNLVLEVRNTVLESVKKQACSDAHAATIYRCGMLCLSICLSNLADNSNHVDNLIDGLNCWEDLLQLCPSIRQLQECDSNIELMVEKLNLLVDFLDMKGYSMARKQSLELLVKLYKILDYPVDLVLKCKITLGVQYLRLGFSGKCGTILSEADHWIQKGDVSTSTKLEWNLAYAEYLISIGEGNLEKGVSCLDGAQDIADNDPSIFAAASSGAKMQRRVDLNKLISRACYVSSLLALEKGNINNSIALARRSLKLIQRAWAGLEAIAKHKSQSGKSESGILTYTTTVAALSGPFLWPIVRSIYDILVHIATLYLHQGMQREALFYVQEAKVVAEAVDSKSLLFHVLSIYGDLDIRLGLLEEGENKIKQAILLKEQLLEKGKELVSLDCTLGIMYRKNKSWDRELDAYNNAEKTLEALMDSKSLKSEVDVFADITEKVANLQIHAEVKSKGKATKPASTVKSKPATKSAKKVTAAKLQPLKSTSSIEKCATLAKLRDDVLRLKAINLAIQQKWDLAQTLLKETAISSLGSRELVTQKLAVARSALLEALAAIDEDDEFHILQETPIAIPSVASVKAVEPAPAKPGKRTPKKIAVSSREIEVVPSSRAGLLLQDARDNILSVQALAARICPTTTLNILSTMLGEVICLLAAITSDPSMSKTIPAINSLELYRCISLAREKSAIEEEKRESLESDDLRWPALSKTQLDIDISALLNFQRDYIDIIPPTWAAISVSLGESREELFFTRYQAGQTPFMIRVPLKIGEEAAMDEEQFGFETGLATFQDIVKRTNISTHSAKDMITKDIRAKWWVEREALDTELHDLLLNIENNWLRGYKGIFGGYKRHPDLVARFNASFVKILNQHLPSRNSGNKKKNKIVTLDERVIELFLGVGDPNEEDVDLEDSIQDLIYFVIDILQFHGEKNAADEIDLDEMIVLITDALESYHKAAKTYEDTTVTDHIVLILDKSVHVLPWESLPCLDGRSVSRLPSLTALRERILMQSFVSDEWKDPGIYISRSNTGYILNPGLDLTNTQKTYEDELRAMSSWEGMVAKIPNEKDFSRFLEEKELFLYFGHGSGAQYIRARTVKKLNNCAVSLLMGCSSGKLTDAGDFEPYGMPLNYIQGGSAAVVVTLWDVTDKDIDKYSSKVFESWGLFKEEKEKKEKRSKGKLKIKHDEEVVVEKPAASSMSLCQAAATSRTVCKMRYLNGAAPVVYGVPIYLK
ncbi:Separin [Dactylella cylindrospora]|nr:Separin [Dactylella cylindrospora]